MTIFLSSLINFLPDSSGLLYDNRYFQKLLLNLRRLIYLLSMLHKSHSQKYDSKKKAYESIHKFNYYTKELFPHLFTQHNNQSQNMISKTQNGLTYHFLSTFLSENVVTNDHFLLHSAKKAYLQPEKNVSKLNQTSFKKNTEIKVPYVPIWSTASQILDFIITNQTEQKQKQSKNFNLYVIHHCQSEQKNHIKWLHFIEQYQFRSKGISYQLAASCKESKEFMAFAPNDKLFRAFVLQTSGKNQLNKIQGFVLQFSHEIQQQIKKLQDPAFHHDHRALTKIPPEHIKKYYSLKHEFPHEGESLLCRYLIAKQYDFEESRKSIKQYLDWKVKITEKYTWKDFEQIDRKGFFRYIGEDRKGRPVIVNRASNVIVDELDVDLYCDFYIYYLEIYLPKKMRGHVTQVLIIADVENLGTNNFKFSITKKNVSDSLKFSPQRQYKMIGVNVSSFAMYWWKIVSPLLPKNTSQKVMITGNERQEILSCLEQEMSEDVIPEYLGGKNKISFNQPSL